jgi:MFS family permease
MDKCLIQRGIALDPSTPSIVRANASGRGQRAGAIVVGLILYLVLPEFEPWYPRILPIFGFFVFGVFLGYAVYLPELFPTHICSTAVGFCIGSARIITSFGPLVAGLLVGAFGGSFNRVTAFMTCFAFLSIIAMLLGRETMGDPLQR